MKKTILYVGGFELPDKNAAAQRVIGNAKAFRELGYEIIFIDIDRNCQLDILKTKKKCYGFDRYSIPYTNKRLFSIGYLKKVCTQYKASLEYIIAYNYPAIALELLRRFCKKNKIKLIADCTEWYDKAKGNLIFSSIKNLDTYLRMEVIQPKLDGMIAISRYLENYYKEKLPTICIPPLVDLLDEKWNIKRKEVCSTIKIVYAGSPGRNKDLLDKIIITLSKINRQDIFFEIIGISKENFLKYYPDCKSYIEILKENVAFLGRISHQEVLYKIKEADFSIFYREEKRVNMAGFPTKFVESISCGTPVITNKTSDIKEYIVKGKNGFLIEGDTEVYLKKIFSKDKSQLKKMKDDVDSLIFNYHNYVSIFDNFIIKEIKDRG